MPNPENDNDFAWVANLINALADFSDPERCPKDITRKIKKVKKAAMELIDAALKWEREEILSDRENWMLKAYAGVVIPDKDDADVLDKVSMSTEDKVDLMFSLGVVSETRKQERDQIAEALDSPPIDQNRQRELTSGAEPVTCFEKAWLEGKYLADREEQGPVERRRARFDYLGIISRRQALNRRRQPPVSYSLWNHYRKRLQLPQGKKPLCILATEIINALFLLYERMLGEGNIDFNTEFNRRPKRQLRDLCDALATPDALDIAHEDFVREFKIWEASPDGKNMLPKFGAEISIPQETLDRELENCFEKTVEEFIPIVREYQRVRTEVINEDVAMESEEEIRDWLREYLKENLRLTPNDLRIHEYWKQGVIPDAVGDAYAKCLQQYKIVVGMDLQETFNKLLNNEQLPTEVKGRFCQLRLHIPVHQGA